MSKSIFGLIFWGILLDVQNAWARAGGGGSGGGGGGGGGGGSGGKSNFISNLVFIAIFITIAIVTTYKRRKKIALAKEKITAAKSADPFWNETSIKNRIENVFYQFQKSWSELNAEPMVDFLTESYFKRMILEMNVLKNLHRKNIMEGVKLINIEILEAQDSSDNSHDLFVAEVNARAKDVLWDTEENKELYHDDSPFTEYWHFKRVNDEWKLDLIAQSTVDPALVKKDIKEFADRNNFYFDPDFGWLMLPKKGNLFSRATFLNSDVNNHVVGYYKNKIVEFYTYYPRKDSQVGSFYLIAQAILPINYKDIVVKRKKFINWPKRGLRRIHLESVEFNKKYCLWAHPDDRISSLELLTPNFMEKIHSLPFELNIEIVDNVLYFYTKNRGTQHYTEMLEVLSWAFEEMKM